MGSYQNEIIAFIYEICYQPIWSAVSSYVAEHPAALELKFSRIAYPDSALLTDMILEFPTNMRIQDDSLFFDAVVSCTLELTEDDYRGSRSCESKQWLCVSCEAVITDKLDSLKIADIHPYHSESARKADGHPVSANIVPILYKNDMDDEAAQFLSVYCPEALEEPMRVPIEDIAEKMGLTIMQGNRLSKDFSFFGEIYFSGGEVEVYDLFMTQKKTVSVKRGTILIDADTYWHRNIGCVRNTIAHEIYHWHKHRMYAAIKQILRGEKLIACRCPSNTVYPKKDDDWSDEQRMEWQANNMAPRILMPLKPFREKVNELYTKYDYASSPFKPMVLNAVAGELATFFDVSRQSVLIRMEETGFKEAASIRKYDADLSYHNYIPESDAFYAYSTDSGLRSLLDSGKFRYVESYFVINDDKYVSYDEDACPHLTDYAWENIYDCTLRFVWTTAPKEGHPHLASVLMHRANADRKISQYDSVQSEEVLLRAEELQEKRTEFERQTASYRLSSPEKTAWELMHDILSQRGIGKAHFCVLTGLDEVVYRRTEKNPNTMPSLYTIVAFACGLNLDLDTTKKILQLAGHAFNDTDEHRALMFCITGLTGQPLSVRNQFLESYGYTTLGTKQLK